MFLLYHLRYQHATVFSKFVALFFITFYPLYKERGENMRSETLVDIGNRIRSKREELGLSQEELKNKTGYSNRSMIARIERGDINITSSKIEAIAKALDTTPAYIMGWDEEESENERMARFYYRYEELSDLEQAMVRKIMNCDEDFNKLGK